MFSFLGKAIKTAVVATVLLGMAGAGAYALMGRHRTQAVVHELQDNLLESIDAHLDNPSMMRSQLRELEREYPERIAQVQGDLAEIRHEIKQLEQEVLVSERVVTLAERVARTRWIWVWALSGVYVAPSRRTLSRRAPTS